MNKLEELQVKVGEYKPDLVMICEVLPKSSVITVTSEMLKLDGYQIFTNIDKDCSHRGVAVYISNMLKAHEVMFTVDFKECVWCSIQLAGGDRLLVGCIYRSPSCSPENNIALCKLMEAASENGEKHKLILGDFNIN